MLIALQGLSYLFALEAGEWPVAGPRAPLNHVGAVFALDQEYLEVRSHNKSYYI